jgi:hypothetical protein
MISVYISSPILKIRDGDILSLSIPVYVKYLYFPKIKLCYFEYKNLKKLKIMEENINLS